MSKRKRHKHESLFSKELQERLEPIKHMDVSDALLDKRFWRAMCEHAGLDFDALEAKCKEDPNYSPKPMTREDFPAMLQQMETLMGPVVEKMRKDKD